MVEGRESGEGRGRGGGRRSGGEWWMGECMVGGSGGRGSEWWRGSGGGESEWWGMGSGEGVVEGWVNGGGREGGGEGVVALGPCVLVLGARSCSCIVMLGPCLSGCLCHVVCTLHSPRHSGWTPDGLQMDSTYHTTKAMFFMIIHLESIWSLHRLCLDSTRFQMVYTHFRLSQGI